MAITEFKEWLVESAYREVVPNIGQIDPATKRELEKLVRRGEIGKWRGYWYPTAGAPWGIGPLKTCYGPISHRDYFASFA